MTVPSDDTPIAFDLSALNELARDRWADNWNFRAFLQKSVDPDEIDRRVHALNAEVSARIDCTTCGNCCREIFPYLSGKDVGRLARGCGLRSDEFRARYLKRTQDGEEVFNTVPCPMLAGTRCGVYTTRPDDCRGYPHLHKPDFLGRSVGVIENYRICPIIYNVYERLKAVFPYDPAVDYIGDDEVEA
jgi:Fe-S-cluster containining protein